MGRATAPRLAALLPVAGLIAATTLAALGGSRTASADPAPAPGQPDPGRLAYVAYGEHRSLQVVGPDKDLSPYLPQGLAGNDCEASARGADTVWVSDRGGDGEGIYLRTGTGPVATVLLRPGWRLVEPELSPDGQWVAFGSYEDVLGVNDLCKGEDIDEEGISLWVVRTDGTGLKEVAPHGGSPSWSPDGRQLAYVDGGVAYTAPADGSDSDHPNRISPPEDGDVFTPAWSPDGGQIAYVTVDPTDHQQRLAVAPASGGGADTVLAQGAWQGADRDVAWSPDGKKLAFLSGYAYLVDPAAGCGSSCESNRLLPDTVDKGETFQDLTWYTPAGGQPAVLLSRLDQETIAIEGVRAHAPVDRLLLRPTIGAEYDVDEPAYSPDGHQMVFTATRAAAGQSTRDESYLMLGPADRLDEAAVVNTGFDPVSRYGRAAWSPDGTMLAVAHEAALPDGGVAPSAISVFDVSGGAAAARLLYTVPWPPDMGPGYECTTDDRDPAWSPDGGRIAFSRYHHCSSILNIAPAEPGSSAARTTSAAVAPMFVLNRETRHIWTVASDRGNYLFDLTAAACGSECSVQDVRPAYRPDGSGVAFTRRGDANPPTSSSPSPSPSGGGVVVKRQPLATGAPVTPKAAALGYPDSMILMVRTDGAGCHGLVPATANCPLTPSRPDPDAYFYDADDAAWSPTGDRLAVDASVGQGDGYGVRIAVVDPATGTGDVLPSQLYNDQFRPSWQASADLGVTIAGPTAPLVTGETTEVTLHVTNNGIAHEPAATADFTLPASLTAVGDPVPTQGTCSGLHCDLEEIAVGETADVKVTVRATTAGTHTVTGAAAGSLLDRFPQDNSASVDVVAADPLKSDPAVTVSVTPPSVLTGDPATVVYTVTNHGDGPATGVELTLSLPPGVTVTSANPGCPDPTCALGDLAPGASATVTRVVTSATPLSGNAVGTVSSKSPDADPGNNTATAPLTVRERVVVTEPPTTPPTTPPTSAPPRRPADPAVSLALAPPTAYTGGTGTTARVTVRNLGKGRATGLTLALTVPPGVIPDAASTCATASGCPVADLDPGATTTVTVALATPGPLTGTVTANLSTTGSDSDTRNDTASAALTVHAPAVVLSPAVGPPGAVTQALGHDFPPGALLQLRWSQGVTVAAAPVRVGADGTFTAPVLVLVQDTLGPRQLLVTDQAAVPRFGEVRADYLVVPGVLQPSGYKWRR
ncbi:NEW3 domain-containing protein [Actinacidiphila bryophytorum]|uniref:NEW3 domain-containing protein n=1 Tax=Actinacidiphila bryophytorum TaxID=1436133 RepID=UPI002176C68D|nr:NEW3 domain-containing protein [Actinacidiphila bryophytorum]UWE07649.1 NEW3 domain-containing protein [Actinacidiphila bryophytorum]